MTIRTILRWVIVAYLMAALLLLHATLLFCSEDHCVFIMEKPPVSLEMGYQLRRGISAMLPYEMKTMQLWAQWLIVGEIMLLLLFILRLITKLFWYALWIGLAFTTTMAIVTYMSSGNFLIYSERLLVEQGLVTNQQIDNWNQLARGVFETVASYFK